MPNSTGKTVCTDLKEEMFDNKEQPQILGEIVIEELSIDGICGVY
ncbi:MAG: mycofactocin precursor [Dehalococcoidales bacterium]|nr:mycofactocin precursor [Dehalococcoidales bacterium]